MPATLTEAERLAALIASFQDVTELAINAAADDAAVALAACIDQHLPHLDPTDRALLALVEALRFAVSVGAVAELVKKLQYLAEYAGGEGVCQLHTDFAPYSFTFLMQHVSKDGKMTPWFNGGLIYSGPGQALDGSAPALTVSLDRRPSLHGWSIHT